MHLTMLQPSTRPLKGRIVLAMLLLLRLSDGQYTNFGSYPQCFVCGSSDQRVGNPTVGVQIPAEVIGIDEITCGTIAIVGLLGQLPPFFCTALQSLEFFKMSCGCKDITTSSDSVDGSSAPTNAYSAVPTGIPLPTDDPNTSAPTLAPVRPKTFAPTRENDIEIMMPRPISMDVNVQINPGPAPAPTLSMTFPPRGPTSPTVDVSFPPAEMPLSLSPVSQPTMEPTTAISMEPTEIISIEPSETISDEPTIALSSLPSNIPSDKPSSQPTSTPSGDQSSVPTRSPSLLPTLAASAEPSEGPSGELVSSAPTSNPSAMIELSEDAAADEEVSCNIVFSFVLRFCSPDANEATSLFHNICDGVRFTCGIEDVYADENNVDIATIAPTGAPTETVPMVRNCGLVGRASVNFCDPLGDDILSVLRAYCDWIKKVCT